MENMGPMVKTVEKHWAVPHTGKTFNSWTFLTRSITHSDHQICW